MGPGALRLALRALDRNIKKLQKAKPEKHAPIREQVTPLACTRRHGVAFKCCHDARIIMRMRLH